MARVDTEVEIDGMKFRIPRFRVMQSFRLKAELLKTFGTTITKIVDDGKGGINLDIKMEDIRLSEIVSELSKNLDPDKLESLFYKILKNTTWESGGPHGIIHLGTEQGFDTAFCDAEGLTPYKLVFEVLKAEYSSFFGGKLDGLSFGTPGLSTTPEK